MRLTRRAVPALALAWLGAGLAPAVVAQTAPDASRTVAAERLTPPPALTLTGVPPIPASSAQRIGGYSELRGASLLDWAPDGGSLLVAWRTRGPAGERAQLHRATAPGAPLEALTRGAEPTPGGRYLPADGRYIVFERDAGGSEATRVSRLDLSTGVETALTEAGQRCDLATFNRAGTAVFVICTPTDRAAGGNLEQAGGVRNTVWLIDVASASRRQIAVLLGTGWFVVDTARDDRTLLVNRFRSPSDTEVWQLDALDGSTRRLLPREGEPPSYTVAFGFAPGDARLFIVSDRAGEFRQLWRYTPATHAFELALEEVRWDVTRVEFSRDRSKMALVVNQAGRGSLRLLSTTTLSRLPLLYPADVGVGTLRWSPEGNRLAFTAVSSQSPAEVRVLDMERLESKVWVAADLAGLDTRAFRPIETVSWPSFDGRLISGLIQRPPPRFTGRRPVLIDIHGGPAAQATLSFNGRYNYLINELGIAYIEPNVRGSTGFGKTFHQLDDGRLREDSVRDIGALLDWIATQPDLDATRVVVQGGSYGGYMALASAVAYSDRLRGAISTVGISHFVTFLERTESYRRDLRRTEYGDEREPAMRAFLHEISPLTRAARIRVPLFVVHGRNDPRVPVQEALQIAAQVAANGVPVWTLIAENEGHGFARKENADYLFAARVRFLEQFLLGR